MADCSVIIPAHNRRATLGRAIASALGQSDPPVEVIVVDDGSSDGTASFVGAMGDRRVKLICHERNVGAASARNTGARAARCRWLAFLDSDDMWLPEKLARQLAQLAVAPPNIRASVTGYVIEDVRAGQTTVFQPSSAVSFDDIVLGCPFSPGSTLVVDAEAFHAVGDFDGDLRRLEDWDWLLRYARDHDLGATPAPLAKIYKTSDPVGSAVVAAVARLRAKHRDAIYRHSWFAGRRFDSTLALEAAAGAYYEGDWRHSMTLTLRAISRYPLRGTAFYALLAKRVMRIRLRGRRRHDSDGR